MAFTTIQGSGSAPDSFLGSAGVDVIALQNVSDPTFLSARQSNDNVTYTSYTNLVGNYSLYGGQGNDTIAAAGATNFNSGLIQGDDGNDTINSISVSSGTIRGGIGDDVLTFTGALTSSLINGNQGVDAITTLGAAASSIFGGQGEDTFAVNGNLSGGTVLQGNTEVDVITLANGISVNGSTINGNQGNDTITIGNITAFGTSTIFGGEGNDAINGAGSLTVGLIVSTDAGNDTATTTGFADTITSTAGNDSVTAGGGADSIAITAGNGTTVGGTGTDSISLGSGNDLLRYSEAGAANVDTVTGFATSADVLSTTQGAIAIGANNFTLSNGNGADIGAVAANALVSLGVARNGGAAVVDLTNGGAGGAAVQLMVATDTTQNSFTNALGTSTATVNGISGAEVIYASWYDAANGQAVIGAVQDDVGANAISGADTFNEIARINMAAVSYTVANMTQILSTF